MDDATIDAIVEAVVGRMKNRIGVNRADLYQPPPGAPVVSYADAPKGHPAETFVHLKEPIDNPPVHKRAPEVMTRTKRHGVFDDLDTAVGAARRAFEEYEEMPLATRYAVVDAMRRAALGVLDEMCERAVRETKLGRVEDKRLKNRVAITKTPGPEFLEPYAESLSGLISQALDFIRERQGAAEDAA